MQPWLDPQRMSYGSSLVPGWTCPHAWWGFSHLRQQNLWLGCAEILIIFHSTRSGGHLHHKVLTMAITTLHKQFFAPCRNWVLKECPGCCHFCTCCTWTWRPQGSTFGYVPTVTAPVERVLAGWWQIKLLEFPKMEVIPVTSSLPFGNSVFLLLHNS